MKIRPLLRGHFCQNYISINNIFQNFPLPQLFILKEVSRVLLMSTLDTSDIECCRCESHVWDCVESDVYRFVFYESAWQKHALNCQRFSEIHQEKWLYLISAFYHSTSASITRIQWCFTHRIIDRNHLKWRI